MCMHKCAHTLSLSHTLNTTDISDSPPVACVEQCNTYATLALRTSPTLKRHIQHLALCHSGVQGGYCFGKETPFQVECSDHRP